MSGHAACMRELVKSRRFEADYHRAIRSGLVPDDWEHLAYVLAKYDSLPEEYGEHRLTDNWEGALGLPFRG